MHFAVRRHNNQRKVIRIGSLDHSRIQRADYRAHIKDYQSRVTVRRYLFYNLTLLGNIVPHRKEPGQKQLAPIIGICLYLIGHRRFQDRY